MTNKNKNPSDSELEPGSSKLFKSLSEEMKLIDSFISDPNKIADLNFQDCFDIIHKCCTIIDKRSLAKYAQVIDTAATTMNNLFVNLSSNIDHNAMDTKNLLQDIKNKLFSPVPYNVIAAKPKENNVPTIQSKPNEYALFVNAKKGMVDANLNSEVNNAISEVRKKKPYLKINKIIRNNKGNIIKTPNSDDLDTLIQYFQSQDKINEIANVFIPKPRDPTIVLKKVSKLTSSKDLPNILCRVNEQISNLDTEVEVLFDFRSDLPFRDIALRVSPRIYERICNLNYLYTDIEAIRFHQRIFLMIVHVKNKPICSECGEEGIHNCSKNNKCCNCVSFFKDGVHQHDICHRPNRDSCPLYKKQIDRLMSQTAFKSYTLPASSSSKSLTAHNELKSSITNDNIDILALQEPYLFNNVFPFSISSRIFHSNMLNGVIYNGFVILNNNLIVEHLMSFTNSFATTISIQTKSTNIILVNIYLHSNVFCDVHQDFFESLLSNFSNFPIILCGDFNARNTYWHDVIVNKNGYKLKEIIDNHDLIVINDKTKTCRNASIIDLTITNSKAYNYIANWSVSRATELSDHETIKFHIVSSNDEFQKHVIKSTWKFIESNIQDYTNHIDIDKLQELNCFIDSCSSPNDINVAVSKLSNIYLEAAYCTFPVRNSSPYPKKYSWWTNDLELQKRHFHFIKNLYYRRSCLVTQDDYKRIRNSYIKNVRLAKRASFRSFLEEADSNNHFGNTFKLLKSMLKKSDNRIPMIDRSPPSNKLFIMNQLLDSLFPDDDPSSDNTFSGGIRNHTLNLNNHTHISRKLSINHKKTNILYLFNKSKPVIRLNSNIRVEPSDTIKILGITFGNHRHRNKINFTPHINNIVEKTGKICNILFALIGNTWGINSKKRIKLFIGMIRPAIVYGCHIWFNMIPVKSKLKLNSLQHQILVKAICAYRTISQNIVSVICDVCKLSDYCEILANTFDSDGLIKGLVRESRKNQFITRYYQDTNPIFRDFFPSLPIPKFFHPNFSNIQFISGHGKFNSYLFRMNIVNSPECECGYEYQSPQHILFNCTFYNLNDHYISSASEFVNCKNNFLLFNYICKQYINMKL
ncbi:hypothetical protein DERP_002929 [Dermatophagoides pteronyssinus]|uniref:Endonuclease/exonuclease/phosphatase domain-containing protein n=1 Tax=Dermatophagoides pteronyssinus TaxID=6956 RepID=A0ABQ8JW33_DERPT|nr:hypothetical protein DERP_002929 [Dermatophagoides pteronyssinus]